MKVVSFRTSGCNDCSTAAADCSGHRRQRCRRRLALAAACCHIFACEHRALGQGGQGLRCSEQSRRLEVLDMSSARCLHRVIGQARVPEKLMHVKRGVNSRSCGAAVACEVLGEHRLR